jgi:hypothetical protein
LILKHKVQGAKEMNRPAVISASILIIFMVSMMGSDQAMSDSPLDSPHDTITIVGDGDLVQTASEENWQGTGTPSDPFEIAGYTIVSDDEVNGIHIENTTYHVSVISCQITGGENGILLKGCENVTIFNTTVSYNKIGIRIIEGESIHINTSSQTYNDRGIQINDSVQIEILNCNASLNNDFGISLHGMDLEVLDSTFHNNKNTGMILDWIVGYTITNCSIMNNGLFGGGFNSGGIWSNHFEIFSGDINNNTITKNIPRGISLKSGGGLDGSATTLIENNNVGNHSMESIYSGRYIICRNNSIFNSSTGIIGNFNCTFIDNRIFDCEIGITTEHECNVIGNDVFNNSKVGIEVGGTYPVARGNHVHHNSGAGIRIDDWGAIIENNLVENNSGNGIHTNLMTSIIKDNVIIGNGGNGTYIQGDHHRLENNVIGENGWYGIYLSGVESLVLKGDHVYENGKDGIYGNSRKNLTIDSIDIFDHQGSGLYLHDCQNVSIRDSHFSFSSGYNAVIVSRGNVSLEGINSFSADMGIWISTIGEVSINGSYFFDLDYGISMGSYDTLEMANTSFDGCGIYLTDPTERSLIYTKMDDTNSVNGRKLIFLSRNSHFSNISGDVGQLIIHGKENISLRELNLSSATMGLLLFETTNISVVNCDLNRNAMGVSGFYCSGIEINDSDFRDGVSGIELYQVDNVRINGCSFIRPEGKAVFLSDDSKDIVISDNLFFRSKGITSFAIESYGIGTIVHGNHFVYNRGTGDEYVSYMTQVTDPYERVAWSSNERGNYWRDHHYPDMDKDGIVDSPYYIEPFYTTKDSYPQSRSFLFDPPELNITQMIDPPKILLQWEKPDLKGFANVENFSIFRRGQFPEERELIAVVPGSQTYFLDPNVTYGKEYSYSISFHSDLIESDRSMETRTSVEVELPVLAIDDPWDGNVTGSDTMTVDWSVDNISRVDHFEIRIDLEEWKPLGLSSSYSFFNLSEGNHIVRVKAVAVGGGEVVDQTEFLIDLGDPSVSIIYPVEDSVIAQNFTTARWSATDDLSGVIEYLVSLDDGEIFSVSGNTSMHLFNLSDGFHFFEVTAFDKGGNSDTTVVYFRVDTFEPSIEITGPNEDMITSSRNVKVTWNAFDIGSGLESFRIRLDDQESVEIGPGIFDRSYFQLRDGRHNVVIIARDFAGNTNQTNVSFTVDSTPPRLTIDSPSDGGHVSQAPVSVIWSVMDEASGVDRIEYRFNSSEWVEIKTGRLSLTGLEEGTYTVFLRAFDKVGNNIEASSTFTVDRTPPIILDYGPTGTQESLDEPVYVSFSERMNKANLRFVIFGINGNINWQGDRAVFKPTRKFDPGMTYNASVTGTDLAGNIVESIQWSFTTTIYGKVRGRIVDGSGNSISNAKVDIGGTTSDSRPDGGFFLELENGNYSLKIERKGYETATMEINITAGEINDLGEIVLEDEDEGGLNLMTIILIPAALLMMILIVVIIGNMLKRTVRSEIEE